MKIFWGKQLKDADNLSFNVAISLLIFCIASFVVLLLNVVMGDVENDNNQALRYELSYIDRLIDATVESNLSIVRKTGILNGE